MMKISINSRAFRKDMSNILEYSYGFLEGVESGKIKFFQSLGEMIKRVLGEYIDSNARVNPEALHHIYEWYEVGSPKARLFNINYTVKNTGLVFTTNFTQSTSVKNGSNVPFYNKASIMESGTPVVIRPTRSDVLVFEDNGDTIFTKSPVSVDNPGGQGVSGQFEKTINTFFSRYFTQAFLESSGVYAYLRRTDAFKRNIARGKTGGRSRGRTTGYNWIVNAGVMAE